MRELIYAMGVSLDGYVAGPDGDIGWAAPDEELHRFHNQQTLEVGAELYGRRMYETMQPWQTPQELPGAGPAELEFARIWQAIPKVVFSTTLDRVEGDARLVREGAVEEVERLKAEPGGPLAVGGAGLAATCIRGDLVDEFRLFISPVVLGGGTPFFPALRRPLDLQLVETRTFGDGVVYLRYRRASAGS